MKILLTGSEGFIGAHLQKALVGADDSVFCVDPKLNFSTSESSRLMSVIENVQPDLILHVGAQCSTERSLKFPHYDFMQNALGTVNVCEAAVLAGNIPVIYTSTVKVYPGYDGQIAPLGVSKKVGEDYLVRYHEQYGLPYIINRPSTIYGPGQSGNSECGWVSWFIRASVEGHQIELAGDGTQSRDILYIQDFVDLLLDQVGNFDAYANRIYDVGGGSQNEVSLNQMLRFLEYDHLDDYINVPRLVGDLDRVVTDNFLVSVRRGWEPKICWKEGVERTRMEFR